MQFLQGLDLQHHLKQFKLRKVADFELMPGYFNPFVFIEPSVIRRREEEGGREKEESDVK